MLHTTALQVNLPSWVNFPDFERVGWLNSVMSKHLSPLIMLHLFSTDCFCIFYVMPSLLLNRGLLSCSIQLQCLHYNQHHANTLQSNGGCPAGQLWPRVNHAVSTMGRQQLDPLMKESKPSWISSVQLDRHAFTLNHPCSHLPLHCMRNQPLFLIATSCSTSVTIPLTSTNTTFQKSCFLAPF